MIRSPSLSALGATAILGGLIIVAGSAFDRTLVAIAGVPPVVIWAAVRAPEALLPVAAAQGTLKTLEPVAALHTPDLLPVTTAGLVLLVVVSVIREGFPRRPAPASLMVVLTAFILIAAMRSTVPGATYTAIYFELFSASLFAAALILLRDDAAYTRLAVGTVAVGAAVALSAHPTADVNLPLSAAGATEIATGLYPAFGAIAALTVLAPRARGAYRVLSVVVAGYLAFMAIRAGSRSDLVAGAVGAAIAAAMFVVHARSRFRAALLVTVPAVAVVASFGTIAGPAALARYKQLTSDPERQFLIDRGVTIARDNPFGTGIGGFAVNLPAMGPFSVLPYPHNVVIELLDDAGVPALAVFLALVVAALRCALSSSSPSAGAFVSAALAFGLTNAMFTGDINGSRIIWLMAGAGLALRLRAPPLPGRYTSANLT